MKVKELFDVELRDIMVGKNERLAQKVLKTVQEESPFDFAITDLHIAVLRELAERYLRSINVDF